MSISYTPNCTQNIEIHTGRLYMRPYLESDFKNSTELYGDERITQLFDHGEPRTTEEVQELVNKIGVNRFKNNSPFGLYSVFGKEDNTFIGHFDFLPSEEPGEAEIGYIVSHDHQGKGYGSEIGRAMIEIFAREVIKREVPVNGKPLSKIMATVHPENIGSEKILKKIGMTFVEKISRFGNDRLVYSMSMES